MNKLFSDDEWDRLVEQMGITERQAEILQRVIDGQTDKQISLDLGIREPTVRSHLQRLFQEFDVSDRTALAITVFRIFRVATGDVAYRRSRARGRRASIRSRRVDA